MILDGKIKSEKMRGMKMRIITCFGDRTRSTDNFDLNVFNGVTSPLVFSYHCVFALFLHNASGL